MLNFYIAEANKNILFVFYVVSKRIKVVTIFYISTTTYIFILSGSTHLVHI